MDNYTVYMHISPSGKKYIGITGQSIERRWGNGTGYKNCISFNRAIEKYGWNNIKHIILYSGLSKKMRKQKRLNLSKNTIRQIANMVTISKMVEALLESIVKKQREK